MKQNKILTFTDDNFKYRCGKRLLSLDLAFHKTGIVYVENGMTKGIVYDYKEKMELDDIKKTNADVDKFLTFLKSFLNGSLKLDVILVEYTLFAGLRGSLGLPVYAYLIISNLVKIWPDAEIVLINSASWVSQLNKALKNKIKFKNKKAKITYLVSQYYNVENWTQDLIDALGIYLAYFIKNELVPNNISPST